MRPEDRAMATSTELGTPMAGSTELKARSSWSRGADSSKGDGDQAAARRLAREFSAPVGLLDPSTLVWRVRLGAGAESCPGGDASLTAVLASGLLWHGRVLIWRPDRDRPSGSGSGSGRLWLCLPV